LNIHLQKKEIKKRGMRKKRKRKRGNKMRSRLEGEVMCEVLVEGLGWQSRRWGGPQTKRGLDYDMEEE
jgi:hypothetical protein